MMMARGAMCRIPGQAHRQETFVGGSHPGNGGLLVFILFYSNPYVWIDAGAVNAVGSFMMRPDSALVWSMYGMWRFWPGKIRPAPPPGLFILLHCLPLKTGTVIAEFLGGWIAWYIRIYSEFKCSRRRLSGEYSLCFRLFRRSLRSVKRFRLFLYPLNRRKGHGK